MSYYDAPPQHTTLGQATAAMVNALAGPPGPYVLLDTRKTPIPLKLTW
jgi:hypothetical protein